MDAASSRLTTARKLSPPRRRLQGCRDQLTTAQHGLHPALDESARSRVAALRRQYGQTQYAGSGGRYASSITVPAAAGSSAGKPRAAGSSSRKQPPAQSPHAYVSPGLIAR